MNIIKSLIQVIARVPVRKKYLLLYINVINVRMYMRGITSDVIFILYCRKEIKISALVYIISELPLESSSHNLYKKVTRCDKIRRRIELA
ncbi:hypothetical protein PUN28_010333 [Cardiocondyla obscurior]|uniref:Uncharacterized protein n=1 Tax=Cardiocondyla obscurior TaxID=286306 RepID=A0AAW2FPR8_9HYME